MPKRFTNLENELMYHFGILCFGTSVHSFVFEKVVAPFEPFGTMYRLITQLLLLVYYYSAFSLLNE